MAINGFLDQKEEDRILTYQVKHDMSYEEAEYALKEQDYNNLVCCGISPEQAKNIIYGEIENTEKTL